MARQALVILLVVFLVVPVRGLAAPQDNRTVQEKVVETPAGTLVEVKLKKKQTLRGRLGEADAEGFSLQYAQGDRVETRKLAYAEVKSIKVVEDAGKGHGILAGIGVAFLVLMGISLIAAAVGGGA